MSDDLIDRLRECAECKSSEAWGRIDGGQDLCIGAALATEAADELSRLRAEVERLTAALADERAHADTLAGALTLIDEHCQNEGYDNPIVDNRIVDRCEETAREALAQHRARRQG